MFATLPLFHNKIDCAHHLTYRIQYIANQALMEG
jgi:hypothetical protein